MRTPVPRRNSIDSKSVDSSGRYQHTQPYDRDRAMAGHLRNCGSQRAELVLGESGFGNKSWGVLKGVPRLNEIKRGRTDLFGVVLPRICGPLATSHAFGEG